jgi:hypothetical protein
MNKQLIAMAKKHQHYLSTTSAIALCGGHDKTRSRCGSEWRKAWNFNKGACDTLLEIPALRQSALAVVLS